MEKPLKKYPQKQEPHLFEKDLPHGFPDAPDKPGHDIRKMKKNNEEKDDV